MQQEIEQFKATIKKLFPVDKVDCLPDPLKAYPKDYMKHKRKQEAIEMGKHLAQQVEEGIKKCQRQNQQEKPTDYIN